MRRKKWSEGKRGISEESLSVITSPANKRERARGPGYPRVTRFHMIYVHYKISWTIKSAWTHVCPLFRADLGLPACYLHRRRRDTGPSTFLSNLPIHLTRAPIRASLFGETVLRTTGSSRAYPEIPDEILDLELQIPGSGEESGGGSEMRVNARFATREFR